MSVPAVLTVALGASSACLRRSPRRDATATAGQLRRCEERRSKVLDGLDLPARHRVPVCPDAPDRPRRWLLSDAALPALRTAVRRKWRMAAAWRCAAWWSAAWLRSGAKPETVFNRLRHCRDAARLQRILFGGSTRALHKCIAFRGQRLIGSLLEPRTKLSTISGCCPTESGGVWSRMQYIARSDFRMVCGPACEVGSPGDGAARRGLAPARGTARRAVPSAASSHKHRRCQFLT